MEKVLDLPPLLVESLDKTIIVGGMNADIHGYTSAAIQCAVDALKVNGKGTVLLNEGVFDISAPIRLYSHSHLKGMGEKTILKKVPGFCSTLKMDADYGELVATVEDASGFAPGMGVAVMDSDNDTAWSVSTAVITEVHGNQLLLNAPLLRDYSATKNGLVSNCCSLVESLCSEDVRISDMLLDGSAGTNDPLDSCRGGAIYLHKIKRAIVENVTVAGFNGDGISWQINYHVTVRDCNVYGCTRNGIHPGAGTNYTIVENNYVHDNGYDGLFVCWRVKQGVFTNNRLVRNEKSGICIGHKDTDNLFQGNYCEQNHLYGLHLREERSDNAPHRCIYENNTFCQNGRNAVCIESEAEDLRFEKNIFIAAPDGEYAPFLLHKDAPRMRCKDNSYQGNWIDKLAHI